MDLKTLYTKGPWNFTSLNRRECLIRSGTDPCDEKNYREVAVVMIPDRQGDANLCLVTKAPEHYEMLLTVNDRIEQMLASDDLQISDDVATELHDIQNTILELLNEDGNLNGIAKYSE